MNLYSSRPILPGKIVISVLMALMIFVCLIIAVYFGTIYFVIVVPLSLLFLLPFRIKYSINANEIVIQGLLSKKRVPLEDLKNAGLVLGSEVVRLRLAGIALPRYLIYGLFTGNAGRVKVYATRIPENVVLLETLKGEKIVISPSDPGSFIKHLKR